jgi:hypothetical protein
MSAPAGDAQSEFNGGLDHPAARGADAADAAGRYIRITVFLATVLSRVGISGHFRVRGARYGLVGLGVGILVLSVVLLATMQ